MRILIIGAGVIGWASGRGFAKFGHEVTFYDTDWKALDKAEGFHVTNSLDDLWQFEVFKQQDICFICVPESDVREALVVTEVLTDTCTIVIRSSVLPGTTARLADAFKRPFIHNPEFLRERNALEDFLMAKWTIAGCAGAVTPTDRRRIADLYTPMGMKVFWTTSTVSEMVKIALNNYLALNISWWNECKSVCDAIGINSHEVGKLALLDHRVSPFGAIDHGRAFSGYCLPKDLKGLIDFASAMGVSTPLLNAVREVNHQMGGKDCCEHECKS